MLAVDEMSTGPTLDGATVEVIRHYLNSTAEQMRRTLVRTAFNPVIYEVLDFGISMYDRNCRLISESSGILFFLGANDFAIHKGVERVGVENLHPGDVVILNYPYWSGAHAADAMMFAPVFSDGSELPDAFLAVRAHWMDLGAKDPGYVLDSTSMHQEGLILPAVKLIRRGEVDPQIMAILRYNSRLPVNIMGDFNAQIAAMRVGERRLHQIWEKFGLAAVDAAIDRTIEHGAQTAAEAVQAMPDGQWAAFDWLDDDGISHDLIRMAVTVTIEGEKFTVDFGDSDGAVPGPVNMPFGCTLSLAKNVFKSLTTPDTPANHGHYRPLRVICPPGNLFHAVYPSAHLHSLDRHGGLRVDQQGSRPGDGPDRRLFRFRPAGVHGRGDPSRHRGDVPGQQQRGDRLGRHPQLRRGQRSAASLHHCGEEHVDRGPGAQVADLSRAAGVASELGWGGTLAGRVGSLSSGKVPCDR